MTTPSTPQDRGEVLRPYVAKLAALGQHSGNPAQPSRIKIGDGELRVDPWEREAVLTSMSENAESEACWQDLLAAGIALRVKSLADIERLGGDDAPAEGEGTTLVDLRLDAAIGFALLAELQDVVDTMVVSGEMPLAKRLTQFRNKVAHGLAALRDYLPEEDMEEAERLAAEMTVDDSPSDEPEKALDTDEAAALRDLEQALSQPMPRPAMAVPEGPARIPGAVAEEERRSFASPLVVILVILIGVWGALKLRPEPERIGLLVFTTADFRDIVEIDTIKAKPPALYVTVDGVAWRRLSVEAREQRVSTVAGRLEPEGYTGATFTDGSGNTVAEWLLLKGVKVYGKS